MQSRGDLAFGHRHAILPAHGKDLVARVEHQCRHCPLISATSHSRADVMAGDFQVGETRVECDLVAAPAELEITVAVVNRVFENVLRAGLADEDPLPSRSRASITLSRGTIR